MRVGNGQICRFWTDNWSPYGSMENHLLRTSRSRLGIPRNATLADLNEEGNWLLPPARSEEWMQIQIHLTTVSLNQAQDCYEWILEDKPTLKYNTSEVYKKLKGSEQLVPWAKVVWNKGGIPRHSFLVWLFTLNRCPTRDRLLSWGLQTDSTCLLCNAADESRDHLLFDCSFSWNLWLVVASKCNLQPQRHWADCLNQLQRLTGDRARKQLTLLGWQAVIYWVWTERNNRLHRSLFRSTDVIFRLLDRQMRDKILALRQASPILSSRLMQYWL
ncbi:hypothetical protein Bca101_027585 [Brassica carinata]